MVNVLPIGTVVNLKGSEEIKFMIVGFFPTNQENEKRDFAAVRYPMGVYDNRMYFFFNEEDISDIIHMGYKDDEFNNIVELIKSNIIEPNK